MRDLRAVAAVIFALILPAEIASSQTAQELKRAAEREAGIVPAEEESPATQKKKKPRSGAKAVGKQDGAAVKGAGKSVQPVPVVPAMSSELDYTLPPKKFREKIESELVIYRQKMEARHPKPPKAVAMILDLEGAKFLQVGKRRLVAGHLLSDGEEFETDGATSVRIGYRTGDQVLVAPRSRVRFHDVDPEGGILNPILEVGGGEIRALVAAPANRPEPPREGSLTYVVRTPEGVFAATGTDYIVRITPDLASVHTLTGTVKYSRELSVLLTGGGDAIHSAHFASLVSPDRILRAPKRLDVGAYLKSFGERLPELRRLWLAADRDAKDGKVSPRFLAAEQSRLNPRVPSAFEKRR